VSDLIYTKAQVDVMFRGTDAVIVFTTTQPGRSVGTTDTARRVRWVSPTMPTIGGADGALAGDVWERQP
jgi:hypothetical protein